jgi:hypothetical protein
MSAPPQATAPNPHTNVYIQIANKMGFQQQQQQQTVLQRTHQGN